MKLSNSEHTGIQMMVAPWEICVNSLTLTLGGGGQVLDGKPSVQPTGMV